MAEIKNKNIAFLIPSMEGGGAQKVTLLLMNELCRRGWKVTLLSRAKGPYLEKIHSNVSFFELKHKSISKNIFVIAGYLKKRKPSFFYSSMTYVNVIAGLAVIFSGFKGKVVFSEHSNLSTRNINNPNFLNRIITSLAKKIYKKADVIVCVSKGVKNDIDKVIPTLKKSVVSYNPVENFYIERKHIHTKFRVVSMGRMDKEKNFSLLIQAFAVVTNKCSNANKEMELYIFGEGYELEKLKALIIELKLQNKVFLPGFIDNPSEILSSANLFVLSSNREGFGNVLVEALSCGLPVISTDCPSGPSEILKNGQLGKLVPVNDVEGMADAIIEAIHNPDKYSTREERMLRARDFSVENVVNQYELLFEDLCKQS